MVDRFLHSVFRRCIILRLCLSTRSPRHSDISWPPLVCVRWERLASFGLLRRRGFLDVAVNKAMFWSVSGILYHFLPLCTTFDYNSTLLVVSLHQWFTSKRSILSAHHPSRAQTLSSVGDHNMFFFHQFFGIAMSMLHSLKHFWHFQMTNTAMFDSPCLLETIVAVMVLVIQ
jgi:hypothetical protein